MTESTFHLVTLGCTFAPREGERFDRAWVQVKLSAGASGWSMLPERAASPVKITRQVEIGADVKFAAAKATVGTERELDQIYVEALNLLKDSPTWRFTRVEGHELDAQQRLLLIVRAPRATATTGEVRLRVVFRRRLLGPLSYRLSIPDTPYTDPDDPLAGRFVLNST